MASALLSDLYKGCEDADWEGRDFGIFSVFSGIDALDAPSHAAWVAMPCLHNDKNPHYANICRGRLDGSGF